MAVIKNLEGKIVRVYRWDHTPCKKKRETRTKAKRRKS